jgi:hypothetical protein
MGSVSVSTSIAVGELCMMGGGCTEMRSSRSSPLSSSSAHLYSSSTSLSYSHSTHTDRKRTLSPFYTYGKADRQGAASHDSAMCPSPPPLSRAFVSPQLYISTSYIGSTCPLTCFSLSHGGSAWCWLIWGVTRDSTASSTSTPSPTGTHTRQSNHDTDPASEN